MNTNFKGIVAAVALTCVMAMPSFAQNERSISWSGNVDDTVIVRIHGDRVNTETRHGKPASNINFNVYKPLPVDHPVNAWLEQVSGRGQVVLVKEPTPENNYTAVVRLKDPQHGYGYYSFVLHWGHRNH